jgi:hypothetical protein
MGNELLLVHIYFKNYQCGIRVDFKGIEFLSRPAAHELLKIKEFLVSQKKDGSFINLGDQANKIIIEVEASFSKSKNADFRFV